MAGKLISTGGRTLRLLKLVFALLCLTILVTNIRTTSGWNEARGVYDDVCYLRQAHLFQRFGVSGLDTNSSRDDDGFFQAKLKEIGYSDWRDPTRWPCHTPMSDHKMVVQYPPGTGFLLALFPDGHQVVPLYLAATLIVCCFALLAIFSAQWIPAVLAAGAFGALALVLMINPTKASYSIAPTMAICALAGFLTARWMAEERDNSLLAMVIGLLLGLSVNLRLANLFLGSGYFLVLGISLLRSRKPSAFAQTMGFGIAFVLGMAPTLIANAINAGSPFATTYGTADVIAPAFDLGVLGEYARDIQSVLILLAVSWITWLLRTDENGVRRVALLVAGNLAINLLFFLSHPIFTPYYIVPIAMLSLWSVCFAGLILSAKAAAPTPVSLEAASLKALP